MPPGDPAQPNHIVGPPEPEGGPNPAQSASEVESQSSDAARRAAPKDLSNRQDASGAVTGGQEVGDMPLPAGAVSPEEGLKRAERRADRMTVLIWASVAGLLVVMFVLMVCDWYHPGCRYPSSLTTRRAAGTIRTAVHQWQASYPDQCPTLAILVEEGIIDRGENLNDPWGGSYRIECTPNDVIVSSAGPDRKWGTKDDIRVPELPLSAGSTGKTEDL